MDFLALSLIKIFTSLENHFYLVQNFIIGSEDADIIEVQQQGPKPLVPESHLHQVAKLDPEFVNPNGILVKFIKSIGPCPECHFMDVHLCHWHL